MWRDNPTPSMLTFAWFPEVLYDLLRQMTDWATYQWRVRCSMFGSSSQQQLSLLLVPSDCFVGLKRWKSWFAAELGCCSVPSESLANCYCFAWIPLIDVLSIGFQLLWQSARSHEQSMTMVPNHFAQELVWRYWHAGKNEFVSNSQGIILIQDFRISLLCQSALLFANCYSQTLIKHI